MYVRIKPYSDRVFQVEIEVQITSETSNPIQIGKRVIAVYYCFRNTSPHIF